MKKRGLKMVAFSAVVFFILSSMIVSCGQGGKKEVGILVENRERTAFQTGDFWTPTTDVRSDIAIVYRTDDFKKRIKEYRDRGYITHYMIGIAWGSYDEFFLGKWDGKEHLDLIQKEMSGDTIFRNAKERSGYYIVPSRDYLTWFKENRIKPVVDAGVTGIYLEEPEFWAYGGYSEGFKREWKEYYGFAWRPQHESAENTYLSNKLKYYLYYRALEECFTYAKEYGKSKGLDVRCYVPTHSLLNYAQWGIVSPEASLASMDCVDGYIAQVWTGTSREQNYYNGRKKERVFETAFLEYGCMESMTAPTGRKVFFLTDPIEDLPRDWADYKKNYQATFAAQLLYPKNNNYEVMPWPHRIYEGLYNTSATNHEKITIPRFYSTQMQVMINTLNDMPLSDNKVSGSAGISVLMANSLMFQRSVKPFAGQGEGDVTFSNFFGQVMPLIKRGVPVQTMHIENVGYEKTWEDTKVLLMSYANMKPMEKEAHTHIAQWVKNGGVLVYCSRDNDPFQTVHEWWTKESYQAPSQHLFALMGMDKDAKEGEYPVGKGTVYVIRKNPDEFVEKKDGDKEFIATVKRLYEENAQAGTLQFKNSFYLERGVYDIISVLDEGAVSNEPYTVKGCLIDLFDPELPVLTEKVVHPDEQAFLLNLGRVSEPDKPQVLCGAARVSDENVGKNSYSFVAKSPINTTNVMRVLLPADPKGVEVTDSQGKALSGVTHEWDERSKTCLISFENHPDGIRVSLNW